MPKLWLYRYPCGSVGLFDGINRLAVNRHGRLDKRNKYVMLNCYRYQIGGWISE